MANPDHLALLKTSGWNAWRDENPNATPDLTDTTLSGLDLTSRNLARADLSRTKILGCRPAGRGDPDFLRARYAARCQ